MTGEDYAAWQTNQYAYDWIAEQLNLTIVGDYVPPVVETSNIEPSEPLNSILADLRKDAPLELINNI